MSCVLHLQRETLAKRNLLDAVVGRFFGDLHVVHMALPHAGRGDLHEFSALLHIRYGSAAAVAHRGA